MKVLVLGGSYFVGLAILEAIVPIGADITCANRGTKPLSIPGVRYISLDRSRPSLGELSESYEVIVDTSGYTSRDIEHVFSALPHPPEKYIFISSAAVYDRLKSSPPFPEEAPKGGDAIWGTYGRDKSDCERLLARLMPDGLYIIRPPYMYGPRNYLEREQFLWARILARKPIWVPGDGSTNIQFCHTRALGCLIRDIITASQPMPRAYNIGERAAYSFLEWIRLAGQIAGVSHDVQFVTDTKINPREYFPFRAHDLTLSVERLASTGRLEDIALEDGLSETFEWFCHHGSFEYKPTALEQQWSSSLRTSAGSSP